MIPVLLKSDYLTIIATLILQDIHLTCSSFLLALKEDHSVYRYIIIPQLSLYNVLRGFRYLCAIEGNIFCYRLEDFDLFTPKADYFESESSC